MISDLGDFQTPPSVVSAVLESLAIADKRWPRVLEPTCGRGNFLAGLLNLPTPPREIQAVELQDAHVEMARKVAERACHTRVVVSKANLFELDLRRDLQWREKGPLLVVGNPPWITSSQLGAVESANLPPKTNLKGLRGIDALTGESNFDIAEYIWLKLIQELAPEQPTIALLCKTSVARNVLRFAFDAGLPMTHASIRRINAKKWFGAAVDACLFCVEIGTADSRYQAAVYGSLDAHQPDSTLGIVAGQLVADVDAYRRSAFADGVCPLTWRQGLKHDAASVMELRFDASGCLRNKLGETVDIERHYAYPLLKSSDLFREDELRRHRLVLVTQKRLGEDTRPLMVVAPRLWSYLAAHADAFDRRKSSVYRGRPPFALFGIGEYSFAAYKVAVSGLYKTARFRAIGPLQGRPVMLDDTCYFAPCSSPQQAALVASLLNDATSLDFIHSLAFWDSKRPITKKLLQRIDLKAILEHVDRPSLLSRATSELRRLGTSGEQASAWPSSLDQFLIDSAQAGHAVSASRAPRQPRATRRS